MSSYIIKGLLALGKFLLKSKKFIPAGLSAIFVIITFFVDIFKFGLSYAFKHMAEQLFAAEYTINKAVTLAIQDSPQYNFGAFLSIISSVFIIYFFIKFVGKLFVKISGSQAIWGAYLMAFLFFAVIEISAVKIIDGHFSFFPIKDGVWFLLMNLNPVLQNIHWIG